MSEPPKRHWYQFSLRTLMIVVAAWAVLLSQSPLVEPGEVTNRVEPSEPFSSDSSPAVIQRIRPVAVRIGEGAHYVPERVVVIASIEAAALIGWIIWRRVRQRGCTRS